MKDKRPYLIVGITAVIILGLFIYLQPDNEKVYDWREHYKENKDDPYGTNIIHDLIKNASPDNFKDLHSSISKSLPDSTETEANYVFIGEGLYLDTADVNQLITFATGGNNVFISSKVIPYDLMYYVYYTQCNDAYWDEYEEFADTTVTFNFNHPDLKDSAGFEFTYIYNNDLAPYSWNYIDSAYFCEETYSFIPLGSMNEQYINFVKMPIGNGAFYLHTAPIAFSNIQLLDENGLNYANKIFTHLSDGPFFWDAKSRVEKRVAQAANNNFNQDRRLSDKSPLKYILQQPPLAWAWYILLSLAFLYLLFRAKRKQRVIPVLAKNENTSLEFISTIGSLYFMQQDHRRLSLQKVKLFYAYVRNHYNLSTSDINENFANNLATRSELPLSLINNIIRFAKNVESSNFVSEKTLIDFHTETERFYQNCK